MACTAAVTVLLALLNMLGCVLTGIVPEATATPRPAVFDEDTGLLLNPSSIPAGEFLVRGQVIAVTLTPRHSPLFKIRSSDGLIFQISAQPVAEIRLADGAPLSAQQLRNGITVQATVFQGNAVGLGGEPVLTSENLTVLELVD